MDLEVKGMQGTRGDGVEVWVGKNLYKESLRFTICLFKHNGRMLTGQRSGFI